MATGSQTGTAPNFGSGAQPPPQLAQAIVNASNRYGLPVDLLAGIWREESGGTFPNHAVNPQGYGGLFGTAFTSVSEEANTPTQQQAYDAAQVLAQGLVQAKGNIAEALSYYNSGKLTGGYTRVPGEVTFGNIKAPSNAYGPTTPGSRAGHERTGGPPQAGTTSVPGAIWGDIAGIPGDVWGALTFPEKVFRFLTSWRLAETVGGFLLLLLGLVLLGRQFGLNVQTPYGGIAQKTERATDSQPRRLRTPTLSDEAHVTMSGPAGADTDATLDDQLAALRERRRTDRAAARERVGARRAAAGRAQRRVQSATGDDIPF